MPEAYDELMEILRTLESHYKDMQDTEFTVEEGSLYMLQTRNAKRPAQAAVRFAVDAVEEGLLEREEALQTIDPDRLDALLHPAFAPDASFDTLTKGVAASPGAAKGEIVFSADDAVAAADDGREVILVRPFTEADDVVGFHAAKGILTSKGGKASHAALVARGMGKPCVAGAGELAIDLKAKTLSAEETTLSEGDTIAIDGSSGLVTADDVALEEPEVSDNFEQVLAWADEVRSLGVRANADTPDDAEQGAGVRGRGHRPLPQRAHLPGHRAPGPDAGHDHGRDRRGARERTGQAARASARALRGAVRGDEGPAGDDQAARSAAARVHPQRRGAGAGGRAGTPRGERRAGGARAHPGPRAHADRDQPDAGYARGAARGAPARGLRDADAGHRPGREGCQARRPARPHCSR